MKQCSKCGELKSREDFWKHRGAPDGRNYYCAECMRKIGLRYRQKPHERERLRKYNHTYYLKVTKKRRALKKKP